MTEQQLESWRNLKLNKQLLTAVEEIGFSEPTDVQMKAIPLILGGQAVIGIAQTGTGKTAAYMLPLLLKVRYQQGNDPRALILVPTKELVVQVTAQGTQLAAHTDLRIAGIYGGVGAQSQIAEIRKGVDILVATPGRFMEIYLRNELPVKLIKTLVLDEADRMMDMGFINQIRKIFEVIPSKRQNLLFSATFHPKVELLSQEFLEFPVKIEITPQSTPARKVEQEMYHVPNLRTKINVVEMLLNNRDEFKRVMIFARTKQNADSVFKFIDRKKLGPVRVVHSNKGQNSRINAMSEFREGKLRVLVSTDVAARGIDVTGVTHVINFDVPVVYEDYVHRIGRTGRAFAEGKAITLVTKAEEYHIGRIEKVIREKIPLKDLPAGIVIEDTTSDEGQDMAREIDAQKKRADPEFQGAFHEKKRQRR
ncbi:MAG TPA: DEAD/DEAH box helicase [Cyclobacteriaceae bacterium]|nr:DEAD/DEAH box helicase [Cyclobacteriaceae bacterium]